MTNPYDLDAKVANRAELTMSADGMRLAFGEAKPKRNPQDLNEKEEIRYHTVIYLPGVVGEAIRDLLTEAINEQLAIQPKPN